MTISAIKALLPAQITCQLNQTWQVIYYEAVRGNHTLLFPSLPNLGKQVMEPLQFDQERKEQIANVFAKLLLETNLTNMKKIISDCSKEDQLVLFLVYLRRIERIKLKAKSSMH